MFLSDYVNMCDLESEIFNDLIDFVLYEIVPFIFI